MKDKLTFLEKWEKVKHDDNKRKWLMYKEWKKIKFKKGEVRTVVLIGNKDLADFIRNFGVKYHCVYDPITGKIEVFNHE